MSELSCKSKLLPKLLGVRSYYLTNTIKNNLKIK